MKSKDILSILFALSCGLNLIIAIIEQFRGKTNDAIYYVLIAILMKLFFLSNEKTK